MTTCPKCGSRFLLPARPQSLAEWMGKLRFVDPLRCLDCKKRFVAPTVDWAQLRYTRCPRCHRTDLGVWTGRTHKPRFWVAVKIVFGANRYRCEYCRINFAGFRKRKEIFSFSRWKKLGLGSDREENAGSEAATANDRGKGAHG